MIKCMSLGNNINQYLTDFAVSIFDLYIYILIFTSFILIDICNHKHIVRQRPLITNTFSDEQYCYGNLIWYWLSWKIIDANYLVSQLSGSYATRMTSVHLINGLYVNLNVVIRIQLTDNRWDYIPFMSKRFHTRSQEYY